VKKKRQPLRWKSQPFGSLRLNFTAAKSFQAFVWLAVGIASNATWSPLLCCGRLMATDTKPTNTRWRIFSIAALSPNSTRVIKVRSELVNTDMHRTIVNSVTRWNLSENTRKTTGNIRNTAENIRCITERNTNLVKRAFLEKENITYNEMKRWAYWWGFMCLVPQWYIRKCQKSCVWCWTKTARKQAAAAASPKLMWNLFEY